MKARTKARKLAAKRQRSMRESGLPDLAPIATRKIRGRQRMKQIKAENDADTPVLIARCRHAGKPVTEATMREAKAQWNGCHAGRAMAEQVSGEMERSELWDAIQNMRKVQTAFDLSIGAPNRHAQCLRLLLPNEAMEADAATPPKDARTDSEKYTQAVSALMSLETWLGYVDKHAASVCKRCVIDDAICTDAAALVRALRCVSDGIKGRKMVYRGL